MKQIIQPEQSTQLSFRHYPVLCAFFREYELFDSLLPKKRHHEVSHAQCILLFVCDCLTARTPLYRYTDLLANLDVEMIFGPGARAEQFNEYTMGETLDAIAKFGEDRLFARVLESEETGAPGSLFIADSSFYTKDNISSFDGTWISHVPEKLKEVQRYLTMEGLPFVDSAAKGYRVHGFDSCYGGIPQRWVLVSSEQMYKRQEKTLLKKQEKQVTEANAKAYHLHAKQFKCEPDALAAATALAAKWPLLEASEPKVSTKTVNAPGRKGRPKAGEETTVYTVSLVFEKSTVAFGEACKGLGKFMLATNDLTLGDEQILQSYKEQQTVERGFRFLKNGQLRLTPVYLKAPIRIQALSFIMCLSLMVYASIENQLRMSLARDDETIRIQDNGPAEYKNNAKPTLMKVFALFENLGTTLVTMPGGEQMLIRSFLPPEVRKVLHYLGSPYERAFDRSVYR